MADLFSKEKRSRVMSAIRSTGNIATEVRAVALFRKSRIRGWRRHWPAVGLPDFVFLKARVAIFVDGCFWHGCPKCYQRPKSNRRYWDTKLIRNRKRDHDVTRTLRARGWRVIRIWEHELRTRPSKCLGRIQQVIASPSRKRLANGDHQHQIVLRSFHQSTGSKTDK
jgi:DNA mismatch endonuclease, patch repair protein